MKLGSLFDGSGGFPLAGAIHGITPMWASEIEPYPIKVTKARFPGMRHLGSVLDVNGADVEPVDIITFGSPCQDLSVAGKREGLEGNRSNLFYEAIRIIKEMRNATNNIYPRIAVWENVPGAFSSNKGEDFRSVLEAFAQINDKAADVPRPASGKWNPAGAIVGSGWSVAWRTFDAQFWGVPQRRKRIYLIADFGSERAGKILFEQEGVRGDSAESGTARESAAGDAQGSAGRSGGAVAFGYPVQGTDLYNHTLTGDKAASLNANSGASASHAGPGVCYALDQQGGKGGANNQAIVFKERAGCPGGGKGILCGDKPFTLSTMTDQAVCCPAADAEGSVGRGCAYGLTTKGNGDAFIAEERHMALSCGGGQAGQGYPAIIYSVDCRNMNLTPEHGTLQAKENGGQSLNYMGAVCYPIDSHQQDSRFKICADGISPTLPGQMGTGGNNGPMVLETAKPPRKYIIRRLTPLECCRLQGFPDWWEDGVQGSDSARYKMWGNGIALPNAEYVIGCAKKLIEGKLPEVEG